MKLLHPGDIILIKTPGLFYHSMRLIFSNTYDHVVLVMNEKESLNISAPTSKLVYN